MSGKSPAFSLYVNEWLGSTSIAAMEPEEEGAYIRLLCHAWGDPDCSLPNDDQILAKLSRLGERWFNGCSTRVKQCFNTHPGKPDRIYNQRLLDERNKQARNSAKKSAAGRKSGEARRYRSNKRSTDVQHTLNLSASATASNSRSKDLLTDRDLRAQKKQPRAGVFSKLTEADLRDPVRLLAWYEHATAARKPVIDHSEHHRVMVFAAAEQAFFGEKPVALFAWIVAHKRWDAISQKNEQLGAAKLNELFESRSTPAAQFDVDLEAFKTP